MLYKDIEKDKEYAVLKGELNELLEVTVNPRNKWDLSVLNSKISPRELEVLILHGYGQSNKEIAESLNIKYETVKNHLYKLTKKLGVKNTTQAFLYAMAKELIKVHIRWIVQDSRQMKLENEVG